MLFEQQPQGVAAVLDCTGVPSPRRRVLSARRVEVLCRVSTAGRENRTASGPVRSRVLPQPGVHLLRRAIAAEHVVTIDATGTHERIPRCWQARVAPSGRPVPSMPAWAGHLPTRAVTKA